MFPILAASETPLPSFFLTLILSFVGGFLGGSMALTVHRGKTMAEVAERLLCSISGAVIFTPLVCWWLRGYYETLPKTLEVEFAAAGTLGITGWFVLHWPINWWAARKDKTPFDILKEFPGVIASIASKLARKESPPSPPPDGAEP